MKLSIKNMVCARCVESVGGIVAGMKLPASHVGLGVVELDRVLTEEEKQTLEEKLNALGYELIFDRETELVNLVKSTLIRYIRHLEETSHPLRLSQFVTENTNYNFSYLSKVFSDNTGTTIESSLINLKIERVKELLSFRKWTLSEIAWMLKYSSVQYLSNQFKKNTGMTVTEYLEMETAGRKMYDQI